jgi:hypothetical protein
VSTQAVYPVVFLGGLILPLRRSNQLNKEH